MNKEETLSYLRRMYNDDSITLGRSYGEVCIPWNYRNDDSIKKAVNTQILDGNGSLVGKIIRLIPKEGRIPRYSKCVVKFVGCYR